MATFFGYCALCIGGTFLIGTILSALGWLVSYLDDDPFDAVKFIQGSFWVGFLVSLGTVCLKCGCKIVEG